jgi:hypothetical protein
MPIIALHAKKIPIYIIMMPNSCMWMSSVLFVQRDSIALADKEIWSLSLATGATQTLLLKEIFRAISLTNVIPRRFSRTVVARVMKIVLKIQENVHTIQCVTLVIQALAAQFAIKRQVYMLWAPKNVASVTLYTL